VALCDEESHAHCFRRAGDFLALRDVAAQHAELAILSPRTPEGVLQAFKTAGE
jgi:hypothetical protein